MNANSIITWVIRYGHVLSAACWVGGYALMAFVIIPYLLKQKSISENISSLTITVIRILTYAGTLTIGFGLVLILHTRGFENLFSGWWGGLVLSSALVAIILLGIGDGAIRPAIKRFAAGGDGQAAQRWSLIGFALTVLAIGMMTATVYVTK